MHFVLVVTVNDAVF